MGQSQAKSFAMLPAGSFSFWCALQSAKAQPLLLTYSESEGGWVQLENDGNSLAMRHAADVL